MKDKQVPGVLGICIPRHPGPPPEKVFEIWGNIFETPSQEVFGCLGYLYIYTHVYSR